MENRAPYRVDGHIGIVRDKDDHIVATFKEKEVAEYFVEIVNTYDQVTVDIGETLKEAELKTELL